MASRSIADLHAALSWDLDDFDKGTRSIESGFKSLIDRGRELGQSFRSIGRDMTLAFTVPIAGMAGAVAAMSKSTAENLKAMGNAAQLSGEDMERFQRQAHAAKSVGVEFDKLGDIFKDTREKIGDFAATGGGEMADFFENIAPRVGITEKAFQGLSGKDSLQLYYNSLVQANVTQEEMVFYMESIADEATALIPLLAKNGEEFRKLGGEANVFTPEQIESLEKYRKSLETIGRAMDKIVIAAVDSGLVDMLTDLATRIADWITRLAETNPGLIRFAAGAALLVAALGPLMMVLSALAIVMLPLFLARLGPVFFALSLLINPIGTVVVFLGKLSGGFGAVIGAIGRVIPFLGRLVVMLARIHPVAAAVITIFTLFGDKIFAALGRVWDKAQEVLGPALQRLFESMGNQIAAVQNAFERLAASPIGKFIAGLIDAIGDLIAALVEIASSAVVVAIEFIINLITTINQVVADVVNIVTLLLQGEWASAWELAQRAVTNMIANMFPSFVNLYSWIHDALAMLGILEARQRAVTSGVTGAANLGRSGLAKVQEIAGPMGTRVRRPVTKSGVPKVSRGAGRGGSRGSARSGPTQEELEAKRQELEFEHALNLAREKGDTDRVRALEQQRDLKKTIEAYEKAGLSTAQARQKAEAEAFAIEVARTDNVASQIGHIAERNMLEIAKLEGDWESVRALEEQFELEEKIAELVSEGVGAAQAEEIALQNLLDLERARGVAIERRLKDQETSRQLELARLRGDEDAAFAIEELKRIEDRVEQLRQDRGISRADAEALAMQEASDRSRSYLQGNFRDAFRGGLQAALDGNLKDFFKRWLEDASFNALAKVLDRLADRLADLVFDSGQGGGGLGSILGSIGQVFGAGPGSAVSGGIHSGSSNSLPGFASGGGGRLGGLAGIDRNVLSLNGTPIARVSQGEMLDVRPANDAGQSGELVVRLKKDGGLSAYLEGIAGRVVNERAPMIGAATQQATIGHLQQMADDRLE